MRRFIIIIVLVVVIIVLTSFINKREVDISIPINIDKQLPVVSTEEWEKQPITDIMIPNIIVEGNFPSGKEGITGAWNKLYPYYYKFLGEPTTFEKKGVRIYYDENISYKQVRSEALNNSIHTGVIGPEYATHMYEDSHNPMYFHMMHEFAHIFFQFDGKMINFDFGQWIWEAHALIAEFLTRTELYNENSNIELYDLVSNMGGWDKVNGVISDDYKYNKEIVDWSATNAIRILTEVMSYDSEFDYIKRVNDGLLRLVNETEKHIISVDDYKKVLDESSNGRLIDGLKPSEWLFKQPVSNIQGKLGNFIIVNPTQGAFRTNDTISFDISVFNRFKHGGIIKELGISNQEVFLKVIDVNGELISKSKAVTRSDGTVRFEGKSNFKFKPGAYKVEVETIIGSDKIMSFNYFIVLPVESEVFNSNDYRMIIIPLDSTGSELLSNLEFITIDGAETTNKISNILVLTAKAGTDIKISYEDFSTIISKPVGGRIIPLRFPNQP